MRWIAWGVDGIEGGWITKVNPFGNLVALPRKHALVEENPEEWTPWNDQGPLAGLPLAG